MSFCAVPAPAHARSQKSLYLAGLDVAVFNSLEIPPPPATKHLLVVVLIHGRTHKKEDTYPCAQHLLAEYLNAKVEGVWPLVLAFDHPNHGSRLVDAQRNQTWLEGNATHAEDMYGIQYQASRDISLLLDFLPSALFPSTPSDQLPAIHAIPVGVSLGGHATWLALAHEPRIEAGCVIVGCPDSFKLLSRRAAGISHLLASAHNGGTPSPPPFMSEKAAELVRKRIKEGKVASPNIPLSLRALMQRQDPAHHLAALAHKRILLLFGAKDTLVPHSASEDVIRTLQDNMSMGDKLQVVVGAEAGHAFTRGMLAVVGHWLHERLQACGSRERSML